MERGHARPRPGLDLLILPFLTLPVIGQETFLNKTASSLSHWRRITPPITLPPPHLLRYPGAAFPTHEFTSLKLIRSLAPRISPLAYFAHCLIAPVSNGRKSRHSENTCGIRLGPPRLCTQYPIPFPGLGSALCWGLSLAARSSPLPRAWGSRVILAVCWAQAPRTLTWDGRTEPAVRLTRRRSRRQAARICTLSAMVLSVRPAVLLVSSRTRSGVRESSYSCFYGASWGRRGC